MSINNSSSETLNRIYLNNKEIFYSHLSKISSGKSIQKASDNPNAISSLAFKRSEYLSYKQLKENFIAFDKVLNLFDKQYQAFENTLLEMKSKSVQAEGGGIDSSVRQTLNDVFQQLRVVNTEIIDKSKYDTQKIFKDTTFQYLIDITNKANNSLSKTVSVDSNISLSAGAGLTTPNKANDALKLVEDAIDSLGETRNMLGKIQSTLSIQKDAAASMETLKESQLNEIENSDFAEEMNIFNKIKSILQINESMIAQANINNESILKLLTR